MRKSRRAAPASRAARPAASPRRERQVLLYNGAAHTSRIVLPEAWILVRDDMIEDVRPGRPPAALKRRCDTVIDVDGRLVAPGLIDLHIHGAGGGCVADADPESILKISKTLVRFGVTGFLASVYPATRRRMLDQIRAVRLAAEQSPKGASILGIHLEGPYLSPEKTGALSGRNFRAPDMGEMRAFIEEGKGLVRLVTIAPELPGAIEMIKFCREAHIRTAVGHSDASHEEMLAGIAAGISHVTHAFNALRRAHHRDPGVMGTVLTVDEVSLEMIVDFVHLHPRIVELLLICKPLGKLVLVSDALRITGLHGRTFEADGRRLEIADGVAKLPDGTIAGSVLTLNRAVANVVSTNYRVPLNAALKMASLFPARCIHAEDTKGCLIHDKKADIAVFDADMRCALALVAGRIAYDSGACRIARR